MNKKVITAIAIVVALALVAVLLAEGWWYMTRVTDEAPAVSEAPVASTAESAQVGEAMDTADKAQSSVSSGVEKTNPFSADVNPMSGYKNPFE